MRKLLFTVIFAALVALPPGLWVLQSPAKPQHPAAPKEIYRSPQAPQGREREPFAVMLLMDGSGSMKKTDPRNYRKPAARLFLSLLSDRDEAGIIRFGDTADVLMPLTANTGKHRDRFAAAVEEVSSTAFSTNITDALRKGLDTLRHAETRHKVILLLSDGKLALGSAEQDAAALAGLNSLLPALKQDGIRIYSIAFTDLADRELLERVARETDGFFQLAAADTDIHLIFASLFEKIKSPDTLPLEGNRFTVDADVRETILLLSKKPGTLMTLTDPSGRTYQADRPDRTMQWYVSPLFDMITMQSPAVGTWTVTLSSAEGNKVFIITNLALMSSFTTGFVSRGEEVSLDVWLEKQGVPLREQEVLDRVVFSAEVKQQGGKSINLAFTRSADGRYHAAFVPDTAGEHSLKVIAEAKTFKREKTFLFGVLAPAAGQQVSQKLPSRPVPARNQDGDTVSWSRVFLRFGIINAVLLAAASIVYGVRRGLLSRRTASGAVHPPAADVPGESA